MEFFAAPTINAGKPETCHVCNVRFEGGGEHMQHVSTNRHHYNVEIEAFKRDRKGKSKNRFGVEISVTCPGNEIQNFESKGIARTVIDFASPGIKYCFSVKNVGETPVELKDVSLLHPLDPFTLEYNLKGCPTPILNAQTQKVNVSFSNPGIGCYDVPICFTLCSGRVEFNVIKEMSIEVSRENPMGKGEPDESPFKGEIWDSERMTVIRGIMPDGTQFRPFVTHPIPKEYLPLFKHKLQIWSGISSEQIKTLTEIRTSFPSFATGNEFRKVYDRFFHSMLYLDEYANKAQLRTFNMTNVPMTLVHHGYVSLQIPGLAEKRPSVIQNDIVCVRVRNTLETWETVAYEGKIFKVNELDVWISGFNTQLMRKLEYAEKNEKKIMFDVRFTLNRYPLCVMHRALDLATTPRMLNMLFPDNVVPMKPLAINDFRCLNPLVNDNPEQLAAVKSILQGTSRPAPYLVFGPPGTGKTVTIVEAILQLKNSSQGTYILVCAPSNAACDYVASKLAKFCTTKELLRLNASSRNYETIPPDLAGYCNQCGVKIHSLSPKELNKFSIIVCTLIAAGRFHGSDGKTFTHVFIDEAGQAKEPEALAAIAGILGPCSPKSAGGQLVLAGDPKQLGPICSSRDSTDAGLGISMLERLMTSSLNYQRKDDGTYDPRFMTKLLHNFRSHPALLEIPNSMFYDGELKVSCDTAILNDPVGSMPLFLEDRAGYPLVFHGVIGQERKEGKSPSFFNQMEIDAVMHYLSILLDENPKFLVRPSEIGIISPYIRQVYKLKGLMDKKGWNEVEVGTTETFQGREKRVILISTVRASRNLLAGDKIYKLGFLDNEKRFNVAITRARSLLVVIGSPHILETDPCWKELISHTKQHNSYHGCDFSLITDEWANDVIDKLSKLLKNGN